MYSNQSFGGANRGPAAAKRPRRSNSFVDVGFVVLAIVCAAAVSYQYFPLMNTPGYNVAVGHLDRIGFPRSSYSYRSRRGSLLGVLEADFSFTAGGKSYKARVTSVPIITLTALQAFTLKGETDKNGLAVRYDVSDPSKCVPVEVIDCFTKTALVSYICLFFLGLLLLIMAGMANLSNDRWRPGMRTDVY